MTKLMTAAAALMFVAAPALAQQSNTQTSPCGCDSTANNTQINYGDHVAQINGQFGYTYADNTQYNEGNWVVQKNIQFRYSRR